MKTREVTKRHSALALRVGVAAVLSIAMVSPAVGADSLPPVPIALTIPSGLPDVPALPFTGVKHATFTTPPTMKTLTVSPNQGFVGDKVTISGTGLPANASIPLTWSTAEGTWVTDIQPNTVNYMGTKYTKFNVDLMTIKTDAAGAFSQKITIPSDFGGIHDIFAVVDGDAVGHGAFQTNRTFTISPTKGPIGTPITLTYTGLGANLYTAGAAVHWDNNYAGELQSLWTRGTGKVVIRAAGPVGKHYVEVKNAITFGYLNVIQSPIPFTNGGSAVFTVTKDAGAPAPSITWPAKVDPTVSARTMLSTSGLDPDTKAVATLTKTSGSILTKTTLNVTGMTSTGAHQIVWATVVGNRVNCTGTCWAYNGVPMANVDVTNGTISKELTIPDNLGGWHVVQVKKGEVIEAQVSFYVKESIMPFYNAAGKQIGLGLAKADLSTTPEALTRGQSGAPATSFKAGEEFTISLKGVGWSQLDNTLAVTYDNTYIGYGCGFNSNGYVVFHMMATGAPGTHIIDMHPLLYTNQPSFANTPYGMVPVLSSDRDFPGLALGYQIPSFHFAITITK